jgi:hypothetical protein
MSEFAAYVTHGASLVTPRVVENVLRQVPIWKVEFTQINAPSFRIWSINSSFLRTRSRISRMEPTKTCLYAVAQAVFALTYAHKKVDVIPI